MKSIEQIRHMADIRVDEDDLPVRAGLRVIRKNDHDYGLSQDEIMDRDEFIRCFLLSEHESLLMVPKPEPSTDFFVEDFQESPFNTHDFERERPGMCFDKYGYRIKKVMEEVKDLAIMHSCIRSVEGRLNTRRKYEAVVDNEFREKLFEVVDRYEKTSDGWLRSQLKRRVAELSCRILECKKIWERYSPPENWQPS